MFKITDAHDFVQKKITRNNVLMEIFKLYDEMLENEIEKLKQMTPISWAHINLYGKYVFHQSNDFQNINEIIAQLDQMRFSY